MANPKHLAILEQGVEAWNNWRGLNVDVRSELNRVHLVDMSVSADLSCDLSGIDLSGVNLSEFDLSRADLWKTDLGFANLSDANLGRALLRGSCLNRADLLRADLSGADLVGAELTGARLNGVKLGGATVGFTIFAGVDLSEVTGLEKIRHRGPSTIGLDTFFGSNGKIPEAFLRGAGVAEIFVQHATSFADTPIQFFSCFISYSHADKAFARRLHDALQSRGIRCWVDEKQLLPGDHMQAKIEEGVTLWDKVLLCCSKTSLNSWWVDKEVSNALKKEERLWKERGKQVLAIIPLNLDGYMFDLGWTDWKKQHLTDRLAADFIGWQRDNAKFDQQLKLVVKALRADSGARELPPKSILWR